MKKFNILFACFVGMGWVSIALSAPDIQPPGYDKKPEIWSGYKSVQKYAAQIGDTWQISSVFGPRNGGVLGSLFHRGIDYNQQPGDADAGVVITSLISGSIEAIENGFIKISSGSENFAFRHVFQLPDGTTSTSTKHQKYTGLHGFGKIVLDKMTRPTGKGTCNAVFFYDESMPKKIVKVLSTKACSDSEYEENGITVPVFTSITAGEPVAFMGKQGTNNVHLHVEYNLSGEESPKGQDNPFLRILHPMGVLQGGLYGPTPRFEISLNDKNYTQEKISKMTEGSGFELRIKENSLAPVLDSVVVYDIDSNSTVLKSFKYGGKKGENRNIADQYIQRASDVRNVHAQLAKGSAKALIVAENWDEMGYSPKATTFFVPYSHFKNLKDGEHTLNVKITTVDNEISEHSVTFNYDGAGGCPKFKGRYGAVIDLGKDGKLIHPVQVDGDHCFYFWDRTGDGTAFDGGDWMTFDELKTRFTGRFATINGVKLALPTVGDGSNFIDPEKGWGGAPNQQGYRSGTAVSGMAVNPRYDDLTAIWDAYNGTGTGTDIDGTPPGWYDNLDYWSATPAALGHAGIRLYSGDVYGTVDYGDHYVAVEVL